MLTTPLPTLAFSKPCSLTSSNSLSHIIVPGTVLSREMWMLSAWGPHIAEKCFSGFEDDRQRPNARVRSVAL